MAHSRDAATASAFGAALVACLLAACVRLAPARAAEAARAVDGDGEAEAKEDDAAQFELSKKVRIVDGAGNPIAGAKVEPWAMRAGNAHGLWTKKGMGASLPPKLTTDADGAATIPFPRYAYVDRQLPPKALTCRVDHPDFVQTAYNDVPVTPDEVAKTTTITLEPGAVIEAEALVDGEPLPMTEVYAQWASSGHDGFLDTSLTLVGKRRFPRLPTGRELVRLAYLPAEGEAMFSAVEQVELAAGQQLQLALDMAPAALVQGRLDANAPRPVENGIVIAEVIHRHPDGNGNNLEWRSWTTIAEDGNFELPPMPAGELQVIAMCDGYMAEAGTAPASDPNPGRALGSQLGPQVFEATGGVTAIEIAMTPTADCTFHAEDPDGQPIAGARVAFWPNVAWWGGGSQVYGWPLYNTGERLISEEELEFDWTDHPFVAVTDDEGNATVRNLPARAENYVITHDSWEKWTDVNRRSSGNVVLKAGETAHVDVTMDPKGTTPPAPAAAN